MFFIKDTLPRILNEKKIVLIEKHLLDKGYAYYKTNKNITKEIYYKLATFDPDTNVKTNTSGEAVHWIVERYLAGDQDIVDALRDNNKAREVEHTIAGFGEALKTSKATSQAVLLNFVAMSRDPNAVLDSLLDQYILITTQENTYKVVFNIDGKKSTVANAPAGSSIVAVDLSEADYQNEPIAPGKTERVPRAYYVTRQMNVVFKTLPDLTSTRNTTELVLKPKGTNKTITVAEKEGYKDSTLLAGQLDVAVAHEAVIPEDMSYKELVDKVEKMSVSIKLPFKIDSNFKRKLTPHNLNVVYNDSRFSVVSPTDIDVSCALGNGSHWCTAQDRNSHFKGYVLLAPLYIIINKTKKEDLASTDMEKRYQLFMGDLGKSKSPEFKDYNDHSLAAVGGDRGGFEYVAITEDMPMAAAEAIDRDSDGLLFKMIQQDMGHTVAGLPAANPNDKVKQVATAFYTKYIILTTNPKDIDKLITEDNAMSMFEISNSEELKKAKPDLAVELKKAVIAKHPVAILASALETSNKEVLKEITSYDIDFSSWEGMSNPMYFKRFITYIPKENPAHIKKLVSYFDKKFLTSIFTAMGAEQMSAKGVELFLEQGIPLEALKVKSGGALISLEDYLVAALKKDRFANEMDKSRAVNLLKFIQDQGKTQVKKTQGKTASPVDKTQGKFK